MCTWATPAHLPAPHLPQSLVLPPPLLLLCTCQITYTSTYNNRSDEQRQGNRETEWVSGTSLNKATENASSVGCRIKYVPLQGRATVLHDSVHLVGGMGSDCGKDWNCTRPQKKQCSGCTMHSWPMLRLLIFLHSADGINAIQGENQSVGGWIRREGYGCLQRKYICRKERRVRASVWKGDPIIIIMQMWMHH